MAFISRLQFIECSGGYWLETDSYCPPIVVISGAAVNSGIGLLPWKEPFSVKYVILNHVLENGDEQIVFASYEGIDCLKKAYQAAWDRLWEGDIIIEGDDQAQRNVRFALYNLYLSARGSSRLSISPMGLSAQGYNGHIFWDAELWMSPLMLLLNQGIAHLPNLRPPFGVLTETPTSQNPYSATGVGGLLQAVINGFAGLRVTDKGIVQTSSVLPEHWKKVTIKGVGLE